MFDIRLAVPFAERIYAMPRKYFDNNVQDLALLDASLDTAARKPSVSELRGIVSGTSIDFHEDG
jgi:hypothetical protein